MGRLPAAIASTIAGAHAVLQGRVPVRVPLVLRHPEAPGHDDDDLGDIPGKACPETHGATELLAEITHLGTAQQDIERPIGPSALSCKQMIDHGLLLRRHFVVLQRLKPIAHQNKAVGIEEVASPVLKVPGR